MLYRKLQKTLEINKTKIDFPGKKIYYDKVTLWIAITTNIILMIMGFVFYILDDKWGFLISIPLCLFFIPSLIRKLLFKNPVFIFQKDRFYYSLEDRWFDKTNSKISYKSSVGGGLPNWSGTIIISDLKEYIVIEENVFYLDDATVFRKEIKQYSSNKGILDIFES